MIGKSKKAAAGVAAILTASAITACGGFGDRSISGLGNGGSRIYANPILDQIVDVLAGSPAVPKVSDETLLTSYTALERRAREGDPEAVLIVFQVAERQRESEK
jgi:hypothetical protein